MATTSTISSKGQITVPIEVRKRLGVKQGDRVEFVFQDGATILRPVIKENNPFEQFVGCLPSFKSLEEIIAWERDMRDGGEEWM